MSTDLTKKATTEHILGGNEGASHGVSGRKRSDQCKDPGEEHGTKT